MKNKENLIVFPVLGPTILSFGLVELVIQLKDSVAMKFAAVAIIAIIGVLMSYLTLKGTPFKNKLVSSLIILTIGDAIFLVSTINELGQIALYCAIGYFFVYVVTIFYLNDKNQCSNNTDLDKQYVEKEQINNRSKESTSNIRWAFAIFIIVIIATVFGLTREKKAEEAVADVNFASYDDGYVATEASSVETVATTEENIALSDSLPSSNSYMAHNPPACDMEIAPNGLPFPERSGYLRKMPVRDLTGLSTVTIDNRQNDSDVFVKLFNEDKRHVSRNFLVKGYSSYEIVDINKGLYTVKAKFLNDCSITKSEKFELEEVETYDGVRYSTISMTLYKIVGGNMHTTPISESDFNEGN